MPAPGSGTGMEVPGSSQSYEEDGVYVQCQPSGSAIRGEKRSRETN